MADPHPALFYYHFLEKYGFTAFMYEVTLTSFMVSSALRAI